MGMFFLGLWLGGMMGFAVCAIMAVGAKSDELTRTSHE